MTDYCNTVSLSCCYFSHLTKEIGLGYMIPGQWFLILTESWNHLGRFENYYHTSLTQTKKLESLGVEPKRGLVDLFFFFLIKIFFGYIH